MPYLICDECQIYYEIDSDFDINELKGCELCNKKLEYYESFDEYYKIKKTLKKHARNIKSIEEHLEDLHEGFFILKNVKIPPKKINFNYIIIGPTGIFPIKIKRAKNSFIIDGDRWFIDKGSKTRIYNLNPNQHIKIGVIEFKKFLESNDLNVQYSLINPLIILGNGEFTIKKVPKNYNVLNLEEICNFVIKSKIKLDEYVLIKSVVLLEPHCSEILKT